MTGPSDGPDRPPLQGSSWQRWAGASTLVDALADPSHGVDDLVALTGADTPGWVHSLAVPPHWVRMEVPTAGPVLTPARMLAYGPRAGGGWDATDTVQVYGYTGFPSLGDVLDGTARTLGDLHGHHLHTTLLAMPSVTGVAAERSTAVITLAEGAPQVWTQLTNYVAASDESHAGRLVVHVVSVAAEHRDALTADVAALTSTVQDAVLSLL